MGLLSPLYRLALTMEDPAALMTRLLWLTEGGNKSINGTASEKVFNLMKDL